jgi:DNA-binding LytR/AlgR family response regulator
MLSTLTKIARGTSCLSGKDKFLIPSKDKLLPISTQDISYFYTTDRNTQIGLRNGKTYCYAKTLEQISSSLNASDFYRANKQFIVARDSVKSISTGLIADCLLAST